MKKPLGGPTCVWYDYVKVVTDIQRAKGWATCLWRGKVLRGRCCEHNDASGSGTGGKHLEAGVSDSNNVLRGP